MSKGLQLMDFRVKGIYQIPGTTQQIRVFFRFSDFRAYYSIRDLMNAYNITENQAYVARQQGHIETFNFMDGDVEVETVTNNQFQRIALSVTGRNIILPMTLDIPVKVA